MIWDFEVTLWPDRPTWTLHKHNGEWHLTWSESCERKAKEFGGEFVTVTELRPGERIVSGEGVRVHQHSDAYYADEECPHADDKRVRGVFYPERTPGAPEAEGRTTAPPRAEEPCHVVSPFLGRTCERGTRNCVVIHDAPPRAEGE